MGCDIHCQVEKKNGELWEKISGFKSDYYQEGHEYFGKDEFKSADSPIDGRNYDLFALLADVRNGRGFAGCITGDPIVPISQPKGLPVDVSEEIKKESAEWGIDGHSHSWLTVKEISGYETTTKKVHRGFVDVETYIKWKEEKTLYPHSWCGGTSQKKVPEQDMVNIYKTTGDKNICAAVSWETTVKDDMKWFFEDGLLQLIARCDESDFSDIRIVFWFDN